MVDEALVRKITKLVINEICGNFCIDGSICTGCESCVAKNQQGTDSILAAGADRIGSTIGAIPKSPDIAKFIDHTLLKPDATRDEIAKLCAEAKEYGFASVCVNPYWVPLCTELLHGTPVKICTVIGFPLGANTTETKVFEARQALASGANEFDMVMNIGALKSEDFCTVLNDIKAIVDAVFPYAVKVILETALLKDEEKVQACVIAKEAGASFVKTSTGFSKGGATVEDVRLMKSVVGESLEVKASGGVRDYETAMKMISAGATRIGASAGVTIVKGHSGKTPSTNY